MKFISEIDQINPFSFTFLTIIKSIILSVMFSTNANDLFPYTLLIEILLHLCIVFSLLFSKQESTSLSKTMVIKSCFFILLLILILWNNVFSNQNSSPKAEVVLIIAFFVYSTCTDLWLYKYEAATSLKKNKAD